MNQSAARRNPSPPGPDRALVMAARSHDEAAIRELIRRMNPRLFRVARGIMPSDAEAEEVVKVKKGDEVTGAESAWAQVSNPEDDKAGWVPLESLQERSGTGGGIWLTSQAFKGVISWFPMVLAIAVFLFAFMAFAEIWCWPSNSFTASRPLTAAWPMLRDTSPRPLLVVAE